MDYCPNCGGLFNIPTGIGRRKQEMPTQHFTIVFNAFVFMQLFNWINCRKLYHEWNVLKGVERNPNFIIIWLICVFVQVMLVEAKAMGASDWDCNSYDLAFRTAHLYGSQWAVCVLLGMGSMVWQWVVIVVGKIVYPNMNDHEENLVTVGTSFLVSNFFYSGPYDGLIPLQ